MNDIVLAVLGSGVISTIISCVFQYLNDRRSKQTQLEEGMSLLLLATLKRDGKELLAQGNMTKAEYESFIATYKAYKALGGDGWADGIKAKVDALERDLED